MKRRETISSGLIRKRISSWTRPDPVTPPPTNWLAKSTCKSRQMVDDEGKDYETLLILLLTFCLTLKWTALETGRKHLMKWSLPFLFSLWQNPWQADWKGALRCWHYSEICPPCQNKLFPGEAFRYEAASSKFQMKRAVLQVKINIFLQSQILLFQSVCDSEQTFISLIQLRETWIDCFSQKAPMWNI